MKRFLIPSLLITTFILSSCGGEVISSSSSIGESIDQSSVVDVKSATKLLATTTSFTLFIETRTSSSAAPVQYIRSYNKDYVMDLNPSSNWGYGINNGSLVSLAFVEDEFSLSSPIKDATNASIVDQSECSSFKGFNSEAFLNGEMLVSLTNKKDKIAFLSLFNLSSSYIVNISEAKLLLENKNDLSSFSGYLKLDGGFTCTFSVGDIGSSSIAGLSSYLKDTATYIEHSDFTAMKTSFEAEDYSQYYYENNKYVGKQQYLHDYFYSDFTLEYCQAHTVMNLGYVGIADKVIQSVKLNGTYQFSITGGKVAFTPSLPYNTSPRITEVLNYPANMELWNNSYLFKRNENGSFYTTRSFLIVDFMSNFQILGKLPSGATATGLVITPGDIGGKNQTVDFSFVYTIDGIDYGITYFFQDFGSSSIPAVDAFFKNIGAF